MHAFRYQRYLYASECIAHAAATLQQPALDVNEGSVNMKLNSKNVIFTLANTHPTRADLPSSISTVFFWF